MIGMIGAFLFILIMSVFVYPCSLDGDRDDRSVPIHSMSVFVYPCSLDGDRDDRSVPIHSNHVYVCLSLQLGW